MVHALEKSHALLKPAGLLLDVHALAIPPRLDIQDQNGRTPAGLLLDRSDFQRFRQAFDAMQTAVSQNLFRVVYREQAEYKISMDSYDSVLEWLDQQWDTSYLPLDTDAAIQRAMRGDGEDRGLLVSRQAQVTGLISLSS